MLVFLHLPKTGGLSVNDALRRSFGVRHADVRSLDGSGQWITPRDVQVSKRLVPGLRSISSHRICPNHHLEETDWKWFTFLREPVARTISEYQFYRAHLGGDLSLEGYIESQGLRNLQVVRVAGSENIDLAMTLIQERFAFVGLMEQFDLSMELLSRTLGAEGIDPRFVRKNVARHHDIADTIRADESQMQVIRNVVQLDTQLFEMVRDQVLPAFAQQFGLSPSDSVASHEMDDNRSLALLSNRVLRNLWYKPAIAVAQRVTGDSHSRVETRQA